MTVDKKETKVLIIKLVFEGSKLIERETSKKFCFYCKIMVEMVSIGKWNMIIESVQLDLNLPVLPSLNVMSKHLQFSSASDSTGMVRNATMKSTQKKRTKFLMSGAEFSMVRIRLITMKSC